MHRGMHGPAQARGNRKKRCARGPGHSQAAAPPERAAEFMLFTKSFNLRLQFILFYCTRLYYVFCHIVRAKGVLMQGEFCTMWAMASTV
ncbi:hypothetical protein NDU88_001148 [Pleurodeles waltl]|uniref:Uncharacterized protein n=1 Tax=Pleurodeles waltl TaxID=8319 RepID=A0AAV7R676_PLEWA|nr:hypothetical protein NDU88_001148 [Pleurodeles waltl]